MTGGGRKFKAVAPVQAATFRGMPLTQERRQEILAEEARRDAVAVEAAEGIRANYQHPISAEAADPNGYPSNWLATTSDGRVV